MSRGEEIIRNILFEGGILYKREIKFEGLNGHNRSPLRFDFGLYKNGTLFALLEFDGEPHFIENKLFHKRNTEFLYRKECDRKKNNFALARKIPLYRIPFWDIDTIKTSQDLFKDKYLVKTQYHNDILINERFGGV